MWSKIARPAHVSALEHELPAGSFDSSQAPRVVLEELPMPSIAPPRWHSDRDRIITLSVGPLLHVSASYRVVARYNCGRRHDTKANEPSLPMRSSILTSALL